MPYLLDTQVVSYFLQARRQDALADAAHSIPCAIVDEVRAELAVDPTRGALFARWFPTSNIALVEIQIGSAADAVLAKLQIGVVTLEKGRGERASIAVAATSPDYVFTGMDKGGLWIALRELWATGERIISLPVFLRRLVEAEALVAEVADDVMTHSSQVIPTWWADWRRGG